MPVHLNRPPHNAHLAAWGHHPTGWWACVTFRARVEGAGEPELAVAAWAPTHAVSKPHWVGDAPHVTRRLELPEDHGRWPAPPRWPAWYAGVWVDGALPLPSGLMLVTGPGWRNKPPRGGASGSSG